MITSSAGFTNAHDALLATRPATHPLALNDASGLPKRNLVTAAAASSPDPAPNRVLIAISGIAASVAPAYRMPPASFKHSQPAIASRQPNKTTTMLWPGIAEGIPSMPNLPLRGPNIQVTPSAVR